ncbi:auxin-responsive protein IAA7-like isoform X2 [Nymphaea colorata]|uniref:auxin-responsive protein IAA7-like isoform X2 n=1 Tax=Nymphaea colorata TaxID=210225 RepID=UPI00129DAECC|nr:auxin-responsive protein IAA7-like isoform X2 [Nymphaea colorata]
MERENGVDEKSGRTLFELVPGEKEGPKAGKKLEGFRGLEEKDLGPRTRETELRLGLPGDWVERETHLSDHQSLEDISKLPKGANSVGAKRVFSDTLDGFSTKQESFQNKSGCFPPWSSPTPPAPASSVLPNNQPTFLSFTTNHGVQNIMKEPASNVTKQEQRAVVGWPPLRSFRKNFAASSSKPPPEKQSTADPINGRNTEVPKSGLFVKINMDGVPIGRKVDLNAYDSYGKLAVAVDELFRGLLAAQRNLADGSHGGSKEEKPITGLLDGSGEYTLVYEDNEGDRMLVGDVPWRMFVSCVKRLRVMKSSDLSSLRGASGSGAEAKCRGAVDSTAKC